MATETCAKTGTKAPPSELLRFVLSPEGQVVPDIKQALPGRAVWLFPRRDVVEAACKDGVFALYGEEAQWPDDLPDRVGSLLRKRVADTLHLLRRSGALIGGFEKVRSALERKPVALVLQATDAAADGRKKLRNLAKAQDVPVLEILDKEAFASITGRENQSHLAVLTGGLADSLERAVDRLLAYELPPQASLIGKPEVKNTQKNTADG